MRAPLTAPADPRSTWGLPDFGELSPVAVLDEMTVRVVAPNPSPMTLDGTNTYVVGVTGHGGAVIVDPGPDDDDHLARVRTALADRDLACELIIVTHHHADHAAAASRWSQLFGCRVAASTRAVAGDDGVVVHDGAVVRVGGLDLSVVATPGHTDDHVAMRLPTGALLTGDHVLGRGTSVVAHPDGDLGAYVDSLRTVLRLGPDALFPGHGPALVDDPAAVVTYYLDHRRFREEQILDCLADGPMVPGALVATIYAEVDRRVWPAAEASTRAALDKLAREDRIWWDGTSAHAVAATDDGGAGRRPQPG